MREKKEEHNKFDKILYISLFLSFFFSFFIFFFHLLSICLSLIVLFSPSTHIPTSSSHFPAQK